MIKDEWANVQASERASRASKASHLNSSPRRIDPLTTDFEYTPEEVEFAMAIEEYRTRTGRKFPTSREILLVAKKLGYHKVGMIA